MCGEPINKPLMPPVPSKYINDRWGRDKIKEYSVITVGLINYVRLLLWGLIV
jgi:hypothetical protein